MPVKPGLCVLVFFGLAVEAPPLVGDCSGGEGVCSEADHTTRLRGEPILWVEQHVEDELLEALIRVARKRCDGVDDSGERLEPLAPGVALAEVFALLTRSPTALTTAQALGLSGGTAPRSEWARSPKRSMMARNDCKSES
eukprot:4255534-Prymnesium_polylepis.1